MHDATSQPACLRLAVAPGVPSSQFSTLLARQRAEEPDVTLTFFEVASDVLLDGLLADRYDVGLTLQGHSDPTLKTQLLWTENMAVAMSPQFYLSGQAMLTIADLQGYLVYRWQAEACSLLAERLTSLLPADEKGIEQVTSFEMMALWVAAGYGIGVSAQSRIERAHGWGIAMRPLSDGPYQIGTYLQRPYRKTNPVAERFERRALQIAGAGSR